MKVLWVCNIMLPFIAEHLGRKASNREGWLTGLAETIAKRYQNNQVELGICFPIDGQDSRMQGKIGEISYYGFYENVRKEAANEMSLDTSMKDILDDFKPDMLHIFGTEFSHALAAAKVFDKPAQTLVGIQGVCMACAEHYMDGIPQAVQNKTTLRDFLRQDNLKQQQKKFYSRAQREAQLLQCVRHVTGRTWLDKNMAECANPGITYHFMNETLRNRFYHAQWKLEDCERFRIFMSQGDYPLKGFHNMLKALPAIKAKYPKVHLSITGNIITRHNTWKEKLKLSAYGKYLLQLMQENNLEESITFLGMADSEAMCRCMLQSHVLVSASTMENSPNSVGEAMLLGLPVVTSDAGGVTSLVRDGEDALLYKSECPDMLAQQVCAVFADDNLARNLSGQARKHAAETYNPEENYKRLMEIYQAVTGSKI